MHVIHHFDSRSIHYTLRPGLVAAAWAAFLLVVALLIRTSS
jgi:hypothetical protein